MVKTKSKKTLVGILVFALMALYGLFPQASHATSYESISDTISDSDLSATGVTHTIVASTTVDLAAGEYIQMVFPAGFTNIATSNLTCPGSGVTASGTGNTVECHYGSGLVAGNYTFTLTGTTNPSTGGGYKIRVYSRNASDEELEKGTAMVAIIDDVVVTATVDATLTFDIDGLATSTSINGVETTASSTYDTLAFGVLDVTSSSTMGQGLQVTTNAAYGYTVTVEQDQNLTANNGADIDSFIDGDAASTTAQSWQSPAGTLGDESTYGHFGVTSDDADLSGGDDYGSSLYRGFYGTDPLEVMYHDGPADGLTANIGSTTVAYTIEIAALQEAGDYTNTLTYICTPTY